MRNTILTTARAPRPQGAARLQGALPRQAILQAQRALADRVQAERPPGRPTVVGDKARVALAAVAAEEGIADRKVAETAGAQTANGLTPALSGSYFQTRLSSLPRCGLV